MAMLSSKTANVVVIAVTGVWVACVFIPLWAPEFDSGPISTVFMSIVGGMLGLEAAVSRKGRRTGPGKTPEKDDTDEGNDDT